MKVSNMVAGAASVLLMGAAALASANSYRDQTVFYSQDGVGVQTTITGPCSTGGVGCTKIINGVTKQLYFSAQLQNPLKPGL